MLQKVLRAVHCGGRHEGTHGDGGSSIPQQDFSRRSMHVRTRAEVASLSSNCSAKGDCQCLHSLVLQAVTGTCNEAKKWSFLASHSALSPPASTSGSLTCSNTHAHRNGEVAFFFFFPLTALLHESAYANGLCSSRRVFHLLMRTTVSGIRKCACVLLVA